MTSYGGWRRNTGDVLNGGKSDDEQIGAAENGMYAALKACGAPVKYSIQREPFLLIDRAGRAAPALWPDLSCDGTTTAAEVHDRCIVRHPDLVLAEYGQPVLIVEIDGAYHDTPAGRKATDRRDRDYRNAGLPCFAVRLSEYQGPDGGGPDAWLADLARQFGLRLANLASIDSAKEGRRQD